MLAFFVMLVIFSMYPTSQTCHQHIWSPKSVTNIDVASADESAKSTISDQNNKYMSSFTFQFPWFACTGMQSNPYYWDFIFPNQAELLLV